MVKFDRPTGTQDFLPEQMAIRNYVKGVVERTFESYGFLMVQTPVFEKIDLLAARSGEEIREGMFTFVCDDTEYALRPEMTAPVCRLVASGQMWESEKPYRVYYMGPCFRYERPQAGRYREFWQAGLELMGSSSPIADAEVMTAAVRVLEHLGVSQFVLKVGNIGIFRDILAKEGFDFDRQSRVISDVDRMMGVREKCEAIGSRQDLEHDDIEYVRRKVGDLYKLQEDIQYVGAYEIFPESGLDKGSARGWLDRLPVIAEDTYRSIWVKQQGLPEEIVNLLIRVSRVRGSKDKVIDEAGELLKPTGASGAFADLMRVAGWLDTFGVVGYEVVLGVARGLDFYTGTVFEIDSPLLGAQKQVCGGGRYDNLVSEFGGPSVPATGFAFGLDRLVEVFTRSGDVAKFKKVDVFVATTSADMQKKAVEIAEILRKAGKRVEVDVMGRDLGEQLGYASGAGCDFTVIVAPDELKRDSVTVKDMRTEQQRVVRISELNAAI